MSDVPKLRFPGFYEEWLKLTIGDLVDGHYIYKPMDGNHGDLHPKTSDYISEGIPFVMANNIVNGRLELSQVSKISKKQADGLRKGFSYEGDVLLTHKGSVGNVTIVPKIDTDYIMLTPQVTYYRMCNGQVYGIFLAAYFQTSKFQDELTVAAGGGTRAYVGITSQLALNVAVPTIDEQKKIGIFLKLVEERIAAIERKVELLKQYKKAVMQKIFTQQICFKAQGGGSYPAWQVKKAGDLFSNVSNRSHNGELPILSITQSGGVVTRDSVERRINKSISGIKNYKIIEAKDFVISLRSFQGGVEMSNTRGISSPAYTVLRGSEEVWPEMYRHYFKRETFIAQLSSTVIGIRDGKQISYAPFSALKLPVPSLREQRKIASFLTCIDDMCSLESAKLESAVRLKKALLQRMFV